MRRISYLNKEIPHLPNLLLQSWHPSIALSPYIDNFWCVKANESKKFTEYLQADGGTGIIFNLGDPIYLGKQLVKSPLFFDGSNSFCNSITMQNKVHLIGIRFKPAGLSSFVNIPLNKLNDKVINICDIEMKFALETIEKVSESKTSFSQIFHIEDWLLKNFNPSNSIKGLQINLEQVSRTHEKFKTSDLAKKLNKSTRQIQRLFQCYVGLTPKAFHRIFRTKHAKFLLKNYPNYSCTDVAYLLNYSDQSHFIHDFQQCAKITPNQYRQICFKN